MTSYCDCESGRCHVPRTGGNYMFQQDGCAAEVVYITWWWGLAEGQRLCGFVHLVHRLGVVPTIGHDMPAGTWQRLEAPRLTQEQLSTEPPEADGWYWAKMWSEMLHLSPVHKVGDHILWTGVLGLERSPLNRTFGWVTEPIVGGVE